MSTLLIHVLTDPITRADVDYLHEQAYSIDDPRHFGILRALKEVPHLEICHADEGFCEIAREISDLIDDPRPLTEDLLKTLCHYGEVLSMQEEMEAFLTPHLGKEIFYEFW